VSGSLAPAGKHPGGRKGPNAGNGRLGQPPRAGNHPPDPWRQGRPVAM